MKRIKIKISGKEYNTIIDEKGIQRFIKNNLICFLVDSGKIDLNHLRIDFNDNKFSKIEYAKFYMDLGYSVSGFAELDLFLNWKIENPLWEKK